MKRHQWFRQTNWTPAAASEFQARLARTRGQRSEYLRIQAMTLAGTNQMHNAEPAVELARQLLAVRTDNLWVAQAHATMAKAFETIGRPYDAIDAYRKAVAAERELPNVRGCYYIDFAWFVAIHGIRDCYKEVQTNMESDLQSNDLVFPATQFRYFGAIALIAEDLGDRQHAKRMAESALAASAATQGPFSRHPGVGVVRNQADESLARIERLARDPES